MRDFADCVRLEDGDVSAVAVIVGRRVSVCDADSRLLKDALIVMEGTRVALKETCRVGDPEDVCNAVSETEDVDVKRDELDAVVDSKTAVIVTLTESD